MAPTVSLSTQTVAFRGDQIPTVKVNDDIYVAMKPIVESLGMTWQSQHRKLTEERYHHMMTPLQTARGFQEMLCLPLNKLNGWLFSVNPAKVKPEIREKLIAYQEECFEALFQYWHGGVAIRTAAARVELPAEEPVLNADQRAELFAALGKPFLRPFLEGKPLLLAHLTKVAGVRRFRKIPQSKLQTILAILADTKVTYHITTPDGFTARTPIDPTRALPAGAGKEE